MTLVGCGGGSGADERGRPSIEGAFDEFMRDLWLGLEHGELIVKSSRILAGYYDMNAEAVASALDSLDGRDGLGRESCSWSSDLACYVDTAGRDYTDRALAVVGATSVDLELGAGRFVGSSEFDEVFAPIDADISYGAYEIKYDNSADTNETFRAYYEQLKEGIFRDIECDINGSYFGMPKWDCHARNDGYNYNFLAEDFPAGYFKDDRIYLIKSKV
jgi:hypothetical protein